jgi:hypothetical protein
MSKYATGKYLIHEFDRVGTRTKSTPISGCFGAAKAYGETQKSMALCHSFAVGRILYNSLEPAHERYDAVSDQ